jgi:hypothetical protein
MDDFNLFNKLVIREIEPDTPAPAVVNEAPFQVRMTLDMERCSARSVYERSLYADIKHITIIDNIRDLANDIYLKLYGSVDNPNRFNRGALRKGIIFACVFHAYKQRGIPQRVDELRKLFDIRQKDALKGLKIFNDLFPPSYATVDMTPTILIKEILGKFKASPEHIDETLKFYRLIENESALMNRSRPQTVAAGVIAYLVKARFARAYPYGDGCIGTRATYPECTARIKEFCAQISMSETTVDKIVREIVRVLDGILADAERQTTKRDERAVI